MFIKTACVSEPMSMFSALINFLMYRSAVYGEISLLSTLKINEVSPVFRDAIAYVHSFTSLF